MKMQSKMNLKNHQERTKKNYSFCYENLIIENEKRTILKNNLLKIFNEKLNYVRISFLKWFPNLVGLL